MFLIRAVEQIFHSVKDEMYQSSTRWMEHFIFSPHEYIYTIALINIHYLYTNLTDLITTLLF